jgi:hypothetical protein
VPRSDEPASDGSRRDYWLSLPERAGRAVVAAVSGVVKPLADHLLPRTLRATRTYAAVVGRLERFLVESVAGVEGVYEPGGGIDRLVARKTVGNVVEVASLAALGVSPVWFLAMAADATRGTRAFLDALVSELAGRGVPVDGPRIRTVDGLLDALERASAAGADVADVPPLDVPGLRRTWAAFRASRDPLPDAAALAALFRDLQATAAETGRSLLSVSSLSGVGTLAGRTAGGAARGTLAAGRAAARLMDASVIEDYRRTLAEIRARGVDLYARETILPYVEAVRRHFDPSRETFTERRLRRRRA